VDLMSLAGTGAGSALGFVLGVVQQRTTREARFEKRVDEELGKLRAEVEACREERPLLRIVTMGAGIMAASMRRKNPDDVVLQVVADAFAALPAEREDFSALLAMLHGDEEQTDEPDPPENP
jgi:hypothetical protein